MGDSGTFDDGRFFEQACGGEAGGDQGGGYAGAGVGAGAGEI